MTYCNLEPVRFPSCKGRLVEAYFSGGAITSDGGAVLLRQADRMLVRESVSGGFRLRKKGDRSPEADDRGSAPARGGGTASGKYGRGTLREALIKSELPAAHGCAAEFDGASH